MESVPDVRADTADIMLLALNKKSPVRSGTPNRAAERIFTTRYCVPAAIVTCPQGKGKRMKRIEVMNPREASDYLRELGMRTSAETLRFGIKQGVFPFGICIETDNTPVYHIFKRLLDDWIAERSIDE